MSVLDEVTGARRARDAVRDIRRLPADDRTKKRLLAAWFDEHDRATKDRSIRHQHYNDLLGRDRNRRLIG